MNGHQFMSEMKKLIDKQIKFETGILAAGSIRNMREYRYHAGRLAAYHDALLLCDDAEKKVNGER